MAKKPKRKPIRDPFRPWTIPQINKEADRRLTALMRPQEQAISKRTTTDLGALGAAGAAAAALLAERAPRTQEGFDRAAQTLAGAGQGFTSEMQARMNAAQEAGKAFALSQGVPYSGAVDVPALGNTVYKGAYEGSANLGLHGALARSKAESDVSVSALSTKAAIAERQRMGEEELIELAAQRPQLRNEIFDILWKRELDKFEVGQAKEDMKIKKRGQTLLEKQFGLDVTEEQEDKRHHIATENAANYRNKLSAKRYNLSLKQHARAIQKAEADGRKINATASKALGYLVDQQGRPILDNKGKRIKVPKEGRGASGTTPRQHQTDLRMAAEQAVQMYGSPATADADLPGRYLAKPGARGSDVFPGNARFGEPATTNNPKKAQRDTEWGFREAQNFLVENYGISKAEARRILIRIGWKPDGKKPGRTASPERPH